MLILLLTAPLLLSLTASLHAQSADDYPIAVHVYRTGIVALLDPNASNTYVELEATIAGQKLILASTENVYANFLRTEFKVMKTGDYKARLLKDQSVNAAEYTRQYEFLLSDGKKLQFNVIGESEN
jgi:hypothetical protein